MPARRVKPSAHPTTCRATIARTLLTVLYGAATAVISFRRRVVSAAPEGAQRRKAPRRHNLHLHGMIAAVAVAGGGGIAEHVAVAQLHADLCGDIRNIGTLRRQLAAARLLGDLGQQLRARYFQIGNSRARSGCATPRRSLRRYPEYRDPAPATGGRPIARRPRSATPGPLLPDRK